MSAAPKLPDPAVLVALSTALMTEALHPSVVGAGAEGAAARVALAEAVELLAMTVALYPGAVTIAARRLDRLGVAELRDDDDDDEEARGQLRLVDGSGS